MRLASPLNAKFLLTKDLYNRMNDFISELKETDYPWDDKFNIFIVNQNKVETNNLNVFISYNGFYKTLYMTNLLLKRMAKGDEYKLHFKSDDGEVDRTLGCLHDDSIDPFGEDITPEEWKRRQEETKKFLQGFIDRINAKDGE